MSGLLVHDSAPSPPDTGSAAYDVHDNRMHFSHFDSAYHVQASDDWKIHIVAGELSNCDAYTFALLPT